jgi:MYXO-CTERM domain-containing protein
MLGLIGAVRPCTRDGCDEVGECDDTESAMLIGGAAVLALGVAAVRRRRSSRDAEHREP